MLGYNFPGKFDVDVIWYFWLNERQVKAVHQWCREEDRIQFASTQGCHFVLRLMGDLWLHKFYLRNVWNSCLETGMIMVEKYQKWWKLLFFWRDEYMSKTVEWTLAVSLLCHVNKVDNDADLIYTRLTPYD